MKAEVCYKTKSSFPLRVPSVDLLDFKWCRKCSFTVADLRFSIFTGPKPKVSVDAFEDFLPDSLFSSKEKQPKTIKEMKREVLAQEMDPQKLLVSLKHEIFMADFESILKSRKRIVLS